MTDNQGSMFIGRRLDSSTLPTAAVLMQLTSTLAKRGLWLDLAWVPREENKEADQLTNEEFQNFSPDLRMELKLQDLDLSVLNRLVEVAGSFEEVRLKLREEKAAKQKEEALSGRKVVFRPRKEKSKWG